MDLILIVFDVIWCVIRILVMKSCWHMESSDSSDKSKGLGSMILCDLLLNLLYAWMWCYGLKAISMRSSQSLFHPINIRAVPTPTGGVSAYHGDMLADARSAVQANFMSGACGTGNGKGCGNDQWMEWRCCWVLQWMLFTVYPCWLIIWSYTIQYVDICWGLSQSIRLWTIHS